MNSLRTRMMLAVSLLAIAAILAVGFAVRFGVSRGLVKYQELERVSRSADTFQNLNRVADVLAAGCCSPEAISKAVALLGPREVLLVVGDEATPLYQAGAPLQRIRIRSLKRETEGITIDAESRNGQEVRGLTLRMQMSGVPIHTSDGRAAQLYVVRFPAEEADTPARALLRSTDRWLLFATVLIALLVLVATWLISRKIFEPILQLRNAAHQIGRGDLSHRVAVSGSDEIADLATSFNQMAARLDEQQELRRNIVRDVVHELRTPLTALRCRIETITDGLSTDPAKDIASANEQVSHLAQLVADLEELASAEARELRFSIVDTELDAIVESALNLCGLSSDQRIRLDLQEGIVVKSDPIRLRQVLSNLLTNAARYTPPEGKITVSAAQNAGAVRIEVSNTGSSLTDQQIAHVFDRFYRADSSRQRATGGSGLGLAIVKHLVEAQGGNVSASSDADSVTITVTIRAGSIRSKDATAPH